MKNKILKIVYFVWSGMLLIPLVALAQFTPPSGTNLPQAPLYAIIRNIMYWLLAIIGFGAVIAFVISGIRYFVSAGNEEETKKAKSAMIAAILGVVVSLLGLVVLYAVQAMLNARSQF